MLKGIVEKALGSLLVAVIIGLSTLMYKEFETYNEIKNLLDVRHELEESFKEEVKDRKANDILILKKLKYIDKAMKKDSATLNYTKEWVDYWVSLRQ